MFTNLNKIRTKTNKTRKAWNEQENKPKANKAKRYDKRQVFEL